MAAWRGGGSFWRTLRIELRTPVAALVTSLEVALGRQRSLEQYQEVLQQALQDAHFLQQLSEGLIEAVTGGSAAHGRNVMDDYAGEMWMLDAGLVHVNSRVKPLADKKKECDADTDVERLRGRMVDLLDSR